MRIAALSVILVAVGSIGIAGMDRSWASAIGLLDVTQRSGWKPDVERAARYADRRAGDVRFAVIDETGRVRKHRAGGRVLMASTFKLMLMAAYLRQARDRDLRDTDRRLLGPMIKASDDLAATEVDRRLGPKPIHHLAELARMRNFSYNPGRWGHSRTTASDQARFIYRIERYVPNRHIGYARRLLRRIVPSQRWGLAEVVPRGWVIRFKGGWGSGSGAVDHQVALLERRSCRIAIALTTTVNPSHSYAAATQRGLGRRLLRGLGRPRC